MLSLSVRAVKAGSPVHVEFFSPSNELYCCRVALNYVRRLVTDTGFPDRGLACVSVIRFPSQYLGLVLSHQYRIGELMFHAVRYDNRRFEVSEPSVEIPIAPACVWQHLPMVPARREPLVIDLRHTEPDILPDDIRDMVPDARLHDRD
jgi:hypothetical protein